MPISLVYVRSQRAGIRVMASLSGFIQWRLRLRINAAKSAVAQPKDEAGRDQVEREEQP